MYWPGTLTAAFLFCLAATAATGSSLLGQQASQALQDSMAAGTSESRPDTIETALRQREYNLRLPVSMADTIPQGFFEIVGALGLNRYTTRLISRFNEIPDQLILQSIQQSNQQVDYMNINAYTAAYAINLLARQDSLWQSFFSDIDMQFREPNILRFNFTNDQKWKSYALNDMFYSTFFQELLLRLGNIGIAGSRDGKQWLDGWPDELRWKYREYRFEYLPEDVGIRVLDPSRFSGADSIIQPSGVFRLTPTNPILPITPADSVEPPYKVPGSP